ncbi:DinB family protein [Flavobacterium sp. WC2509]|uniref:DinB family protein n=1 Tax=Flavobacterium sp. WC2509 TaxID=3461406 RepID=UPI004043A9E8
MLIETLKTLFDRDLNRLRIEIELYTNEENIWKIDKNISNSAGNLCLHLMGNLNTYIGAEIGKTNYIRNRELEFSLKNISKAELIESIEKTKIVVATSLDNLTDKELEREYPILVFDNKTATGYLLIHLTTHLTYHLGQINYHRRLLDLD